MRLSSLLLTLMIVGCVVPPPPATPPARPAPPPPPAPSPPAPFNWADRPVTPGLWSYTPQAAGGVARYGVPGALPLFTIRCDRQAGQVMLARQGAAVGTMTLRATTGARSYGTLPGAGAPDAGGAGQVTARLAARDPQLDAMAFSRGRMLIGLDGADDLILPTWPEFTRVIEDCR